MSASPEAWARAREAWENGASNPEAGKVAGVTREAVRRRAQAEGWQKRDGAAEQKAEEARQQTAAARAEADRRWHVRRAKEADAAGVTAARARLGITQALDSQNPQMVRAAAIAYGILIDKAQLLSGEATARIEGTSPKERALAVLSELEERRARKQQQAG